MAYLVDTSWIIKHLRGQKPFTEKLQSLQSEGLAVSIVTVAELDHGAQRARDPAEAQRRIDRFLVDVRVLSVDRRTCRVYGKLAADLEGNAPGALDLLIGATALQHRLTVLTTDAEHFSRIEGLTLITEP